MPLIKAVVFAFVIATIPSYHGYYVKGGSLEVGRASTQAVVWTSVVIILCELLFNSNAARINDTSKRFTQKLWRCSYIKRN